MFIGSQEICSTWKLFLKGKFIGCLWDFSGDYNRSLTVYDKVLCRPACTNFGFNWEEVELDSFMLKNNFIAKQFDLCLRNKKETDEVRLGENLKILTLFIQRLRRFQLRIRIFIRFLMGLNIVLFLLVVFFIFA